MNELAINYDQQATLSTYSGGGTGLVGVRRQVSNCACNSFALVKILCFIGQIIKKACHKFANLSFKKNYFINMSIVTEISTHCL